MKYRPYPAAASPASADLDARKILPGGSLYRVLIAMLELGQSKPWPDALEALTGSREMDATAILDYFAPLKEWLDQQNEGQPVGW